MHCFTELWTICHLKPTDGYGRSNMQEYKNTVMNREWNIQLLIFVWFVYYKLINANDKIIVYKLKYEYEYNEVFM